MARFFLALTLFLGLLLTLPSGAIRAWGIQGHAWIHSRAIDNVGGPFRLALERRRTYLVEHSVDADKRRSSDREEAPRHFIDLDGYGSFPFKDFSLNYEELVRRVGSQKVRENGLVLWTIEQYYKRLVDAMRQNNPEWVKLATDLGHYVSDLHQPFHAVLNYNGQLSGQHGIHFRFEEEVVNRNLHRIAFKAVPAFRADRDPLHVSFDIALESLSWADNVLVAEYKIVRDLKINRATLPRDDRNFPIYPDAYYERLWKDTSAIIEQRMNQAASRLANLWYGAWQDAGKPALD